MLTKTLAVCSGLPITSITLIPSFSSRTLTSAHMAADTVTALRQLHPRDMEYATRFVDRLLADAAERQATDVHLQPTREGLEVRWRLDGVLQSLGVFPPGEHTDVVTRLKVVAGLLTYRSEVPQEGRIGSTNRADRQSERRVSTFPTLYGERAVVRLFAAQQTFRYVTDLGLPAPVEDAVNRELAETSGALVVAGPAGSGKTTTVYACLRELVRSEAALRSIVSLEDPIEVAVDGVAQSQVQPASGFDFAVGLRSLMRQDPEVIMIGEIRDRETAETAYAASLTGHLLLTTFHAGSSAEALSRLAEMGVEPYMLRSGTRAVLCQRLVRRLCDCKRPAASKDEWLDVPAPAAHVPVGCSACGQTGYGGRLLVAELLPVSRAPYAHELLVSVEAQHIERVAVTRGGMVTAWRQALQEVERGMTSPAEVRRVFGFSAGAFQSGAVRD